jgi:hypothetical protein
MLNYQRVRNYRELLNYTVKYGIWGVI